MAGTIHVDNDFELVRRGYDPAQVQELVGKLSSELKALAAENDRLRAQLAERAEPTADRDGDVFAHWSAETNALLDAARASIAAVQEQAAADAAAILSGAETEATAVRQQAQLDAELVLTEARKQADDTLSAAQLQAGTTVAEADAHRAESERAAEATLEQINSQVADATAQLAELVAQRAAISQHLGNANAQLTRLLSLVEPNEAPAAPSDAPASAEPNDEHA